MDPLSAVGLAGTIVQFIDFGTKIVVEGRELYNSDTVKLNDQVEAVTNDLLDFTAKFQKPSPLQNETEPPTENELAIRKLRDECETVAQQLLARLARLKPTLLPLEEPPDGCSQKEYNSWSHRFKVRQKKLEKFKDSLRLGLLSVWNRKDIEEMGARLEKYRAAIQTRMIGCLGDQVQILSARQSQRFEDLDRRTKIIAGALLDDIRANIADDIRQQTEALALLIGRREIVILDQDQDQMKVVTLDHNIPAIEELIDISKGSPKPLDSSRDIKIQLARERLAREWACNAILTELHFQAEKERYENVTEAHTKTFGWIYHGEDSALVTRWDSFIKWLELGDGLYWINGKAGSGKSTLMKYISDNPRTRSLLSLWAGNSKLCTAHFYFWNLGTELQKSQVGLLRSLILAVLESNRDLIPLAFPQEWARVYNLGSSNPNTRASLQFSVSSLSKVWSALISYVGKPEYDMKLAVFVDGLDEFDGLDADMARLFGTAANSARVKVCVSSRPHVMFEKAFAKRPSLRLQDLTYNDITTYVEDRLVKDESMQYLIAEEPVETQGLVEEIVTSADGVFLWVYLVVSSLLKGLGNCDDISDLRRKLRLLPKNLKQLYRHMIENIDEDYREEATHFFELINATHHIPADPMHPKPLTILGLCLAKESEENFPLLVKKYQGLSRTSIVERCKSMSRRLNSRTGGLIEVRLNGGRLDDLKPEMKVGYLHRTVGDFLMTQEVRGFLHAETGFDADHAMLKSSVVELQISNPTTWGVFLVDYEGDLQFHKDSDELYFSAFIYAKRCQSESKSSRLIAASQTQLLDQLYHRMPRKQKMPGLSDRPGTLFERFLYNTVELGLVFYIEEKMKTPRHLLTTKVKRELLDLALETNYTTTPRIILALLTSGIDPFVLDRRPQQGNSEKDNSIHPLFSEHFRFLDRVIRWLDKNCEVKTLTSSSPWAQVLQHLLNWKIKHGSGGKGWDRSYEAEFKVVLDRLCSSQEANYELQGLLTRAYAPTSIFTRWFWQILGF